MTAHKYIQNYPRPQFVREAWTDLNGTWDFQFDDANAGEAGKWYEGLQDARAIQVPFTYETEASGIGEAVFHPYVWYQRNLSVPGGEKGKRVLIHFQAVDYRAKVWVNGTYVGGHEGGYSAFSFDITNCLRDSGDNILVVKAEDSMDARQPRGKQRWLKDSYGCWYVQTTGIWQSVWLEYVERQHLHAVKMTPNIDTECIHMEYAVRGFVPEPGLSLRTVIRMGEKVIKDIQMAVDRASLSLDILLRHESSGEWKIQLWHPRHPNLYDVEFVLLKDGKPIDTVYSYFGMRKISIEKGKVLLNNMPYYQRLLLDQGYWKDSHLTPPSEDALIEDIDRTKELGFNGVRKHQKLEDPRFLYWCDRKGLLVWSEMPAAYEFDDEAVESFTRQWMEVVRQHYNHPSIITWVPFNESWGVPSIRVDRRQQQFTEAVYHLTKAFDSMRPVVANDGWEHTVSDIITLHDYEELGSVIRDRYKDKDRVIGNEFGFNGFKYPFARGYGYNGQPILISEYGGIAFNSEKGWGYGNKVKSEEDFLERFRSVTQAIKELDFCVGYCYTQLTDVQQEVNGLLTEDRKPKIDPDKIREINHMR